MNIKQFLKENPIVLFLRLIPEIQNEIVLLCYGLGTSNTHHRQKKFEASITINYHAIEKGMSLSSPRIAFGENKVFDLISELRGYNLSFPNSPFLLKPIGTIISYLEYNKSKGHVNNELATKLSALINEYKNDVQESNGGIIEINKKDILKNSCFNYKAFVLSRHSIRSFGDGEVPNDVIKNALKIAQHSPSACNRQPWKTYILKKERKDSLLYFQGGSKGFAESIYAAILITSDLNNFFIHEIHQAYIDGGLYAMSLLYAFHSLGIGSIPLATSFKRGKRKLLYKNYNIPKNEVPIMIIGIGNLKEQFNVACSTRKSIEETNVFIN